MKLNQLSVFLENKPGQLTGPCKALSDAGINILTLSLADTQQFGILRLIVREWEQAKAVLQGAGWVVKVTPVVAVEVADRPGGLESILEICEKERINIEYMYAFTSRRGDSAVLIFAFEDADQAVKALQDHDINMVGNIDLYEDSGAD